MSSSLIDVKEQSTFKHVLQQFVKLTEPSILRIHICEKTNISTIKLNVVSFVQNKNLENEIKIKVNIIKSCQIKVCHCH